MNIVAIVTLIGGVTGLVTGVGGLWLSSRKDKNTNVQAAIDLALTGSGGLIKNLQDEVKRNTERADTCEHRCDELEEKMRQLVFKVDHLELEKSEWEAREIAYKRRLGEL